VSGLGRQVSSERDLWRAVWQHVDTFLDRIGSQEDNDKTYATTMCALYPVFAVIERARKRSVGYRLSDATAAVPGGTYSDGTLIATVSDAVLQASNGRIPGVEECEFACAPYRVNDDGSLDDPPWAFMTRSITLATFRDQKHGDVHLRTPTYDFGQLSGAPMIAINIGDGGLFPKDARQEAMNGGHTQSDGTTIPANFTKWSDLRAARLVVAQSGAGGGDPPLRLSAQLANLTFPLKQTDLSSIASTARNYAQQCRDDANTLDNAKQQLAQEGISDDVIGAIAQATHAMNDQASAFDTAATTIDHGGIPSFTTRAQWVHLLALAEGDLAWPSMLPTAIDKLDSAAASAMNGAVENRIGYPDGPLRQLRMLQWTLRFFWEHRTAWMSWRHSLVLAAMYRSYMTGFTESLKRVIDGQHSGIGLPAATKVGKQTLIGATELPLSNWPDLSLLAAGSIAIVTGDRPTAAPAIDVLIDGKKLPPVRLKIPSLAVSVETGANLPGTPGLVAVGTPITDHYRKLDAAEWLRGAHRPGVPGDGAPARAADGIVQALIAHHSRLALLLGDSGGDDRPAPPAIPRPYGAIAAFDLEGTITPSDNRLFLKALPAPSKSGTGEQLSLATPGEFLLLLGHDQDGAAWQTAIEVDHVVITTGTEAKKDEGAGATPVPPCCADDQEVMVIYLRQMYLPSDVTELHAAFLHRSFGGFGARSLLTRTMLPETVDPSTASKVTVGSHVYTPRRDPELEVAWRVFDEFLPKETA
jgi:hypothetical protein